MPNILIIDDDASISDMLSEALSEKGYAVQTAYSGTEALMLLSQSKPDLILLDLMLPGLSGEELLPKIKEIPVIVVSAKADVTDKVGLLLGGAADYITKPFDLQELLARITVQLRKQHDSTAETLLHFQEITLHTDTHTIDVNGTDVKLTRTEYAILKLLMQNAGQVVAKLTILERISADTPDCTEDSLKIHIHNLRKKLKVVTGREYITAVWGIGFMLTDKS
ncbi:response regulator transcription factor [uncultured Ruminococcus sp.]|uniref:response regulator transcription factor n=1 Tax=uncultured Ruminococcus sp. TaxID=165186 RepID=UPI0025FE0B85|nr:response regulator transcription factor [uncultured Ruminococcus sp.]